MAVARRVDVKSKVPYLWRELRNARVVVIQKQPDPDSTLPVVMIVFLYVIAVAMGLAIRALTWPEQEHVTALFFVPSVILPICVVSLLVFTSFIFHDANIHYAETRKFIAKEQEINLKAYARKNMAIAAWSSITPGATRAEYVETGRRISAGTENAG